MESYYKKRLHRSGKWLLLVLMAVAPALVPAQNGPGAYKKEPVLQFVFEGAGRQVFLLRNNKGLPEYYMANLTGGVCTDGLCRPVNIDIYWDLLGRFKDYHTTPANRLTKFDHVDFTGEDHKRLKRILADTASLLQDYQVEDLIDTTVKRSSHVQVDAVTGATQKSFADAVVPGAVYTVYKLWHFVNGSVREQLLDHSRARLFTEREIKRLLLSGNRDYQYFLIGQIRGTEIGKYREILIRLIGDKDEFVPLYALSKLPEAVWREQELQKEVLSQMKRLGNPARSYILEKLSGSALTADVLKLLLDAIPELTKPQWKLAFGILNHNRAVVKAELLNEVKQLLRSGQQELREQVNDLLIQL